MIELISRSSNIDIINLIIVGILFLLIGLICLYLLTVWEQRSYEKSILGKPLPSNRVLNQITKDIPINKPFIIKKENGKWVAKEKKE